MDKKSEKRTLSPFGNFSVLSRIDTSPITPGGIHLPDSAKRKSGRGRVLAVGPGERRDDGGRNRIPLEVGNVVVFDEYSADEVDLDGTKLLLVPETAIRGVIVE